MDSFYGGKQGISFVLKASFPSVDAMISAFKGGSNYTDVWYGEHCIIDTPNKNDKDNGKLYRRGFDYQDDMGGAVYLGQIVGPSSGTPYFQLMSIDDVKKESQRALDDYEYRRYPYDYDEENEKYLTTDGINPNRSIQTFEFNKDYDETLIPGKYIENGVAKYNDAIKFTWCNVRRDSADADSYFYVGWQQPYLVTDYKIHQTSPYDDDGNILDDATEIERIDDNSHPFYEHWDLGLPKGIKGDTLRNLRVIVPTNENKSKIYASTAITVDSVSGETSVGASGYPGIDEDIAGGKQIIVFDYYVYDKMLNPSPIMIYLGDFNIITDIKIADDGTLTIEYTHDDNSVFTKKIRWIDNVALTTGNGANGGHFTVTFNNDSPFATKEFDLTWIKGIEIDDDGSIIYTYAGKPTSLPDGATPVQSNGVTADPTETSGFYRVEDFLQWINSVALNNVNGKFTVTNNRNQVILDTTLDWVKDITFGNDGTVNIYHTVDSSNEQLNNLIKWVTDVSLNQSSGLFTVNFNYGDSYTAQLDWVEDVEIDEDTGNIYIQHVNNSLSGTNNGQELLDAKLKLVIGASISSDGVITLHTNTGEDITVGGEGGDGSFKLKYIDNVTLNTGIFEDKHIQIKYNTESAPTPIGDPINYIQDIVVRSSDWHLLVLYNDPAHRYPGIGGTLDSDGKDKNGIIWVNNISGSDGSDQYRREDLYWRDMGAIKDQAGILVGMNITYQDVQDFEDADFDPNIAGTPGNPPTQPGTGVVGYLQYILPQGLNGAENSPYGIGTKEKIITYTPPPTGDNSDKQDKEFYAYDYNTYQWYYLGKIADSGSRDVKLLNSQTQANAGQVTDLNTRGLAFKEYELTLSDSGMPKYWDVSYTGFNV